ncbi:MAG: carbamate kinase [Gaiellaceae bacterium]
MTAVVALGGNALMRPGERGTAAEQRANLRRACDALRPLLTDRELVITHGNGPQVGNELLRQERAADEAPPLPLYLAVAQTQAEIGALIESELEAVAGGPVACLLTHVLVAEDDPAFEKPTKPVGPFYDEAKGRELEQERGWNVVFDAGRGWRRVVPSPQPLEVVELGAIRALLAAGTIVVACGGGGIPAMRRGAHLAGLDAVIDKDRASSLLARDLGADRLVILTEVDAVFRDFGTDKQKELRELSVDEAEALRPELEAGSMRPKIEACVEFVQATGHAALITSPAALGEAIEGRAGTVIR